MSEKKWAYVFGVLLILVSAWRGVTAAQLKMEKAEHETTKAILEASFVREKAWGVAYQKALESSVAQQDNAQACLDREAQARTDVTEREAILGQAMPRPRSQTEKVVDDATRNAVASRLNRAL